MASSRRLLLPYLPAMRHVGIAHAFVLAGITGFAAAPNAAHAQTVRPTRPVATQLTDYLARVSEWGFEGAVIVEQHGRTILAKGYGKADSNGGQANTVETLFDLGSLSKQFTAAAAMSFVESGQLDLAAPISRYFDNVPPDKSGITVHQLLTHTSGMPREVAPDFVPLTRLEFERRAFAAPLVGEPGRQFSYSNAGYGLVAALIERVSRKPFTDAMREKVFAPAKLQHTGFYDDIAKWGRQTVTATAHGSAVNGQSPAQWRTTWGNLGSAGVVSSASDLLAWEHAIRANRILAVSSWQKLFTPYDGNYGYAWTVQSTGAGAQLIRHDGAWYAFSSDFRRLPADSSTVIVLANRVTGGDHLASPVAAALQEIMSGGTVALPPGVTTGNASNIATCVGEYRLGSSDVIRVSAERDALHLEAVGAGALLAINGVAVNDAARDSITARSVRTRAILEGAWKGDYSVLRQVTAQARAERYASALEAWRVQRNDSLGVLTRVDIIGALPATGMAGGWNVLANVVFAKGTERVALGWGPLGALVNLATENPELPDWSSHFRPIDHADAYAAYDVATRTVVTGACRRVAGEVELELIVGTTHWRARKS